jgi:cell division protease FtsH
LIEDNRDKVEATATALLEIETLDSDQVEDIMQGRPPRPPKPAASTAGTTLGPDTGPDAAPSANPA